MRILIAEDDAFFQKLLQQILAHNHEIIIANNGNEAWEMLQRPDAPRLAILDWVMPGLSGPRGSSQGEGVLIDIFNVFDHPQPRRTTRRISYRGCGQVRMTTSPSRR